MFFTKSAMVRSEAQPGSSRAGNKRPKDKSSEGTSPGHKPSSHKKPATQREQVEGDPQRLEFNAENQQGVLLLPEAPAHDKQPESQPAYDPNGHLGTLEDGSKFGGPHSGSFFGGTRGPGL